MSTTCLVCFEELTPVTGIRVHPGCKTNPDVLVTELFQIIERTIIGQPRSQQRRIGPSEIGLAALLRRVSDGVVSEVVLANNFTHEGEATAHFLSETLGARGLRITRLARGVPVGGELEFVDPGTIAQAFYDRRDLPPA